MVYDIVLAIPSGYVKIATENDHLSWIFMDFPFQYGDVPQLYQITRWFL